MKTLMSVLAKIEALQHEAEEMRKRERVSVIARVQEAIQTYKITIEEIQTPVKLPSTPQILGKRKKLPVYVRPEGLVHGQSYTNGKQVWTGHGRMPQWLRDHVEQTGKPLKDCVIINKR